jgi:hypothetical protein
MIQRLNQFGPLFILATLVVIVAFVLSSSTSSSDDAPRKNVKEFLEKHNILVGLRQDIGTSHWPVLTKSTLGQRYFDQGLRFVVAYNFRLAVENFLQAQLVDPACAMCAWGEALARGQNLNDFMDLSEDNVRRAWDAVARARKLNTEWTAATADEERMKRLEQQLIEAIAERQRPTPKEMQPEARKPLNEKYAEVMQRLAEEYPDHDWVLFFAADAQMNTSPWNYWEEMLPAGAGATIRKPRIDLAVKFVARILQHDPMHAGALHLQIHLFESAADPAPAIDASRKLDGMVPGSEHLLHMPSHGYVRAGEFRRAALVNQHAQRVALEEHAYPQHNIETLVYSFTANGNAAEAFRGAWLLHALAEKRLATGRDGYEAIFPYERFVVAPLYTAVVFSNWSYIESRNVVPVQRRVYERCHYHFARGRMYCHQGDLSKAAAELRLLGEARQELEVKENIDRYSAELYPARRIAEVLSLNLQARMDLAAGKRNDAAKHLLDGWREELQFYYDEPPSLFFPACTEYVDSLLMRGNATEARNVAQACLKIYRGYPWLLRLLAKACGELKDDKCELDARTSFVEAWEGTR